MQWAMGLAAEATGQSSTTAANARRLLLAKLREKLGGSRIVPVFSRQIKQTFDLSKRSRDTAIHKRNGEMILSFLDAYSVVCSLAMALRYARMAASRDTAIHKRNGEMILSFLARVFRRVLARDGSAVCPDGRSPVAACSDTVLEAVTHFEPRITVMRTRRPVPPMKSETGIAQFSVGGSYVVRRSRAAEAKLLLEFLNCKPTLVRIGHVVSCSV